MKNITIDNKYAVKHFIEKKSYCDLYTGKSNLDGSLVSLSIYNASKISRDDLDENGDLKEVGFLKLGIKGLPKLIGIGEFTHDLEKYVFQSLSNDNLYQQIIKTNSY